MLETSEGGDSLDPPSSKKAEPSYMGKAKMVRQAGIQMSKSYLNPFN
jgi:hypothetical protein